MREAARRNAKYRPHAISALGDIVAAGGIQKLSDVVKLIEPVIEELTGSTEDLVEDHGESM